MRFNQRYGHDVRRAAGDAAGGGGAGDGPAGPGVEDGQVARRRAAGIVYLLDEPDVVRKKIMRAVTDSGRRGRVRPGGAARGGEPAGDPRRRAPAGSRRCWRGELRVVRRAEEGRPPTRWWSCCGRCGRGTPELCADPVYVDGVLRDGAERARALARPTVDAAYAAIGLLPPA